MKILTIKEPYATLIKEGIKKYEFRTWKTNYRGPILIHAGKGKDKKEIERRKDLDLKYSSGEIIAKVDLTDCIEVTDEFREELKQIDAVTYKHIIEDKSWKGYAFKLENTTKVEPVKINGKLSFWEYDYKSW